MAIPQDRLMAQLLKLERDLAQSRQLATFRRNPSTWELLLYLSQFAEGSEDGVYNIIGNLQTRYLGSSAMLKFMRERRDDGLLMFTEHTKRSKWKVAVHPDLREELVTTLMQTITEINAEAAIQDPGRRGPPQADGAGYLQIVK